VLVAKLAMSELAGYGGPAVPGASLQGIALNPWDRSRYAGGSSGGSAIAVALGAVPFALGTETAGSVVGPAAFCGVTGFRPSPGRIPRDGMLVLSPTLDKVGILARTAAGCATVFGLIRDAGPEAATVPSPRVGYVTDEAADWAPGVAGPVAAALDEVQALGRRLPLTRADLGPSPARALRVIMLYEAAGELRHELTDAGFHLLDAGQEAGLRAGVALSAAEYQDALAERRRVQQRFARLFERCDVLVTASRPDIARPTGAGRTAGSGSVADRLRAAANLAGLPGVTVPAGLSTEGLPTGLHLVGPAGGDELVLDLAARFQSRTAHHELRPPG
jgi:aspartyl-tRNA(Asn)/glutamyl-tRNA(Gln) amidotransferase subunit A